MRRLGQWALPLLLAALLALRIIGALDGQAALIGTFAVELGALAWASWRARRAVSSYRLQRQTGVDSWTALRAALERALPGPAARLIALEARLWICLCVWALRRNVPRAGVFPYARHSMLGGLLVVIALGGPVEALVVHLLLPWAWLRWTVLALEVYGAFWLLGYYASLRVLPHQLEADGLRLRYGALAEAWVPYHALQHIELERRAPRAGGEGALRTHNPDGEPVGWLVVGGRTDLTLTLDAPATLTRVLGRPIVARQLHVAADDAPELQAALRARVRLARPDSAPAMSSR
jgi:hypothetical protein